jgi:hypothetical protein
MQPVAVLELTVTPRIADTGSCAAARQAHGAVGCSIVDRGGRISLVPIRGGAEQSAHRDLPNSSRRASPRSARERTRRAPRSTSPRKVQSSARHRKYAGSKHERWDFMCRSLSEWRGFGPWSRPVLNGGSYPRVHPSPHSLRDICASQRRYLATGKPESDAQAAGKITVATQTSRR